MCLMQLDNHSLQQHSKILLSSHTTGWRKSFTGQLRKIKNFSILCIDRRDIPNSVLAGLVDFVGLRVNASRILWELTSAVADFADQLETYHLQNLILQNETLNLRQSLFLFASDIRLVL